MFECQEIKSLIDSIEEDKEIKSILIKIKKYDELQLNLNELNKLLKLTNSNYYFDIINLKEYFKSQGFGYTKIIKDLKIPKATLSQMLNSGRNIKLKTLNRIFDYYNISKETLREEN